METAMTILQSAQKSKLLKTGKLLHLLLSPCCCKRKPEGKKSLIRNNSRCTVPP
jgi:hypothetical protein